VILREVTQKQGTARSAVAVALTGQVRCAEANSGAAAARAKREAATAVDDGGLTLLLGLVNRLAADGQGHALR
jgi:hypothetical protein